jgi:hypothetical protein
MAAIKFLAVCDTKYRRESDGKGYDNYNDSTMSLDRILNSNSK